MEAEESLAGMVWCALESKKLKQAVGIRNCPGAAGSGLTGEQGDPACKYSNIPSLSVNKTLAVTKHHLLLLPPEPSF